MSNQPQSNYPNLNPQLQNARDTVVNSELTCPPDASAAYDSLANGPAAEKARIEGEKTSQEYSNLLSSRKVPEQPAATGQPLTHYHSFFYNLLSWQNPRVTTISFASIVTFIFFTRYVPILKYFFKGLYLVLGITATAEIVGKLVMDRGFASRMRPRKYYTIPRQSLEASLDDVEQLINFFVIELQRIIFAENIFVTAGAFVAAFIGYFLVKFVPKWGLALLATTLVYTVPLIYINNREAIDAQLNNAGNLISEQTQQVRNIAAEQTSHITEIAKTTASDYTAKAQELIGQAKNRAGASDAPNPANLNPAKDEPERDLKKEDFSNAANVAADKASNAASVAADQTKTTAQNAADTTSAYGQSAANTASDYGNSAANTASNYGQSAADTTSAYGHSAADTASSYGQAAADKTSAYTQSAADKAPTTAQSDAGRPSAAPSASYLDSDATELNAPSVPIHEPSAAAHSETVLPDVNAYHENSEPEAVRSEAPLY